MPAELIVPTIAMTLALVFYTTGVFAERGARALRGWHVASFWAGWGFDAWGTEMMSQMRAAGVETDIVHTVTGASAFLLMLGHAIWATWVVWRGTDEARRGFSRYSIVVWAIWLIPYLGGMIAGMMRAGG